MDDDDFGLEDVNNIDDLQHLAKAPTPDQQLGSEVPAPEADFAGRPQISALLVELTEKIYRLGMTDDGRAFAAPHDCPHWGYPIEDSRPLHQQLAAEYYATYDKVPSATAIREALAVCAGKARGRRPEHMFTRVAQRDDTIYLDIGDASGRVIRLTGEGWGIETQAPVLFRRSGLTAPFPEPRSGGDINHLWDIVNVTPAYRPVLLAWLVAGLRHDIPHPVLGLFGEQGTGKTTATRTLAGLLDPSTAPSRRTPRNEDGWVVAAASSWVIPLDNLSTLPAWLSDAMCRAVTGDADVTRTFYTNADLTVFSFRRVIVMNGIDLGSLRGDLAERMVAVRLDRIPDTGRQREGHLQHLSRQVLPEIFGALLDLAVEVERRLPSIHLDRLPRMADFAQILAAIDQILGTEGLDTYRGLGQELATDAMTSEPILMAITNTIDREITGTATEILRLLETEWVPLLPAMPRRWPRSPRDLTTLLRRHAQTMRALGWTCEDLGSGGKQKAVRFTIAPPS